jgi:hypothetical protein
MTQVIVKIGTTVTGCQWCVSGTKDPAFVKICNAALPTGRKGAKWPFCNKHLEIQRVNDRIVDDDGDSDPDDDAQCDCVECVECRARNARRLDEGMDLAQSSGFTPCERLFTLDVAWYLESRFSFGITIALSLIMPATTRKIGETVSAYFTRQLAEISAIRASRR